MDCPVDPDGIHNGVDCSRLELERRSSLLTRQAIRDSREAAGSGSWFLANTSRLEVINVMQHDRFNNEHLAQHL